MSANSIPVFPALLVYADGGIRVLHDEDGWTKDVDLWMWDADNKFLADHDGTRFDLERAVDARGHEQNGSPTWRMARRLATSELVAFASRHLAQEGYAPAELQAKLAASGGTTASLIIDYLAQLDLEESSRQRSNHALQRTATGDWLPRVFRALFRR